MPLGVAYVEGEADITVVSEGVGAGERREIAEGDGEDEIFGFVSILGDGGRARAGETDGTRLREDWLLGLRP